MVTAVPSEDPAIEVDDVTKEYGGTFAVSGAGFTVSSGEVLGLLGANGAGKTTAIKMICGLVEPTSGRVRVHGYNVARQRGPVVSRLGAVLEGSRNIYWNLSAWENVVYFGRLKGLRKRDFRERAEWLLRSLELWERRDEVVGSFSRGMQQKVAIAAVLVADPSVVLLDEPTLGLDIASARVLKDWIGALAREHGKAVLLTTHQLDAAEELCDRIAIMRSGRIALDLPLDELLRRVGPQCHYEIEVRGGRDSIAPLGFTVFEADEHRVLRGPVESAAALYGALDDLRSRGAELIAVRPRRPELEEVYLRVVEGVEVDD